MSSEPGDHEAEQTHIHVILEIRMGWTRGQMRPASQSQSQVLEQTEKVQRKCHTDLWRT
jgi:hypothetical protein